MCWPQPAQVGFLQMSQVTRAHMVVPLGGGDGARVYPGEYYQNTPMGIMHVKSAAARRGLQVVDRAGFLLISTALRGCLSDPEAEGTAPEDLEKLFLTLA